VLKTVAQFCVWTATEEIPILFSEVSEFLLKNCL